MKHDIDKMVQELLDSLGMTSENYEDVVFRAVNVALVQLGYANHEVGEAIKELKKLDKKHEDAIKKLQETDMSRAAMRDAENNLMLSYVRSRLNLKRQESERKRYAKRLQLGLDLLDSMYRKTSKYKETMP